MLVLVLVSLGLPLALSLRDRVAAEVHSRARSQADVVAATAAELLRARDAPRLRALLGSSAAAVRGRVIVVDARGRLVADSAAGRAGRPSYADRPEIATALRGRSAQETRRSETLHADILATAVPIRHGPGAPVGAVRITQSVTAVHRAVRRSIGALAGIGLLVLAVGLAAGAAIAAQLARPIHRLDDAAHRVERGDLDARARVEGSTEQQRLARTFNAMTERLARLLRGQQAFVADASHHLRTPLAGVRLRLEEARAMSSGPAAAELDAGMQEVDRLADIVEELLVLSRSGERELPGEWVDAHDAAVRACERWAPAARTRRQRLALDGATGSGRVWCAPADLDRILDVLLGNALRYSPAATTVRLVAAGHAIEVLDDGPGLAPGEEDAVFERFHRGAAGLAGPSGSGLGLPIARELAAEWAGSVALANRPDGGVRATVRFPRGAASSSAAGPPADADPADTAPAPALAAGRRRRAAATGALAATVGIALAGGLSYTTGTLTSRRIGLSAEPISAGAGLAPPRAAAERATNAGERRAAHRTPAAAPPTTTERRAGPPPATSPPGAAPVPAPAPRPTAQPVSPRQGDDDYGGSGEGSGEADD